MPDQATMDEMALVFGLKPNELHRVFVRELRYILERLVAEDYLRLVREGKVADATLDEDDPESFAMWIKDYPYKLTMPPGDYFDKYELYGPFRTKGSSEVGSIDFFLTDEQGESDLTLELEIHKIGDRVELRIYNCHVM